MYPPNTAKPATGHSRAYEVLIGLTALAILLQGVSAGIFLRHDGERDAAGTWIDVHARGAEVALFLAAIATVTAFIRLRQRRDLWIGAAALSILIALEAFLGGLIRDSGKVDLTVVHVPLAMMILGLVIWLSIRARQT